MDSSQADPVKEVKRLVKVTVFFNKKPGITDEEFHRYWSERHGPLVTSFPNFQEKVLKYNQYHNDMSLRNQAASLIGIPAMEFDGAGEFVVTDLESLLSALFDPEFEKVVTPDEQKFLTHEVLKVMIGYDDLMVDRT